MLAFWVWSDASEFFRDRGLMITDGGVVTFGCMLGVGVGGGEGRDGGISGVIANRVRRIVERGWSAVKGGLRMICPFSPSISMALMTLVPLRLSLSLSENQPRQRRRSAAGLPSTI
jgi:hypothetical protein